MSLTTGSPVGLARQALAEAAAADDATSDERDYYRSLRAALDSVNPDEVVGPRLDHLLCDPHGAP